MSLDHAATEQLLGRLFGQTISENGRQQFAVAWKNLAEISKDAGIDPKAFPQLEAFAAGSFIGSQDAAETLKFEAIDLAWQMLWHGAQAHGLSYQHFLHWLDRRDRQERRK